MKIFSSAGRPFFLPRLLGAVIVLQSSESLAHSVVIWAETIDDRIEVEAFLSNGVVPKQGRVVVEDEKGKAVLRGSLDNAGRIRFPTPLATALTLKVIFDSGHEGSIRLRLNAVAPAQAPD